MVAVAAREVDAVEGALLVPDRDNENVLAAELEEIRTFPHRPAPHRLLLLLVSYQERMKILPVYQIRRAVEEYCTPFALDPGPDQLVPALPLLPHRMVPIADQLQSRGRGGDDGVAGVLLPAEHLVLTGGEAGAAHAVAAARVDDGRHTLIDDRTARPAAILIRPAGSGSERGGLVAPLHQIRTRRVVPVNVAPQRAVGIVLVEEVVDSLPLDETIRVVHPVLRGQEMVPRAVRICVHRFHNVAVGQKLNSTRSSVRRASAP